MSDMKCHEEGISRMLFLPYLCSRNFSHCEIERYWSMVKKESEQGLQYKVYTREATDKNAEKSAQVLGGEFWYE